MPTHWRRVPNACSSDNPLLPPEEGRASEKASERILKIVLAFLFVLSELDSTITEEMLLYHFARLFLFWFAVTTG